MAEPSVEIVLPVDFPGILQIVSFEAFACLERCPGNGNPFSVILWIGLMLNEPGFCIPPKTNVW